ncbi:SDR family oxidoreductase [Wukongibacter baidiensis]|uniref:SDR family NAD(P)-dependent oxidoreductase n=1 Tax=Wukongibacter baidiensis TaxID=1723361 RepID=UPI003D7F9B08
MLERKDFLSLEGKVAVITGAASGIGLGTAQLLAAHGAAVAMLDVNPMGEEEAEKIREAGKVAQFYKCDVTSSSEVKNTVKDIKENFGRIDILFNNAGVTVRKTVVELEEKEWDFVLDVGLKGTFLLSKFVIPVMAEGGGGSIINTGSGWGLKGGDQAAAYCAVKGGIVNLTRAMAIDHGPQNIRVNSVNPGDTDTAMLRDEGVQTGIVVDEKSRDEYLEECGIDRPLKRIGMPEDIANAVLFLASDLSSWVTGAALVVDGGGIA